MNALPLQPLRIPTGWSVTFNDFCEIDPETIRDPDSMLWSYFHEDMLLMEHAHISLLVDLGWYPDGDSTGTFRAIVVRKYTEEEQAVRAWQEPIAEFMSRSVEQVVAQLEAWFLQY